MFSRFINFSRIAEVSSIASLISLFIFPTVVMAEDLESQTELKQANPQNIDRSRSSKKISGYAGGAIGILVLNEAESLNAYLSNSIYGGVRFNKYLATDIEVGLLGVDDVYFGEEYSFGGIFFNPRLILPLGETSQSISLYISPGLKLITIGEYEGRSAWQIKSGISFPIGKKINLFGQLRRIEQEDRSLTGVELGSSFNF